MKIRLVWILFFLLSICYFTACGQKEGGEASRSLSDSPRGETMADTENSQMEAELSWQASYHPLERRYDLALAAGTIYGCVWEDGQVSIDSIGKESFHAEGSYVLENVSLLAGMAADGEGHVFFLEKRGERAILWKISEDGVSGEETEIELEDTQNADNLSLKGMCADADGYFYIWCGMMVPEMEVSEGREREVWHDASRVYVKDPQLQTVYYEEIAEMSGTRVLDFQVGSDGGVFFLVKDSEGLYIQEIEREKKGQGEKKRLTDIDGTKPLDSLEHIVSVENGFMYCQNNTLYEFRFDTKKTEKILNLSTYGINSSDILFLAKNGDAIEIIDNHGDQECSEFVSLVLGQAEKKTVTLGVSMLSQGLEKAVVEFNRTSGAYRVEIIDYFSQTGDFEEAKERLKLDFVTDQAPDVIALSEVDYRTFSKKGAFSDLYDFMREDAACSQSMLVQSVAKACEDGGHLYRIAPAFLLHTMWGYGEVTGGQSGVTFSKLLQMLRDSGKDWSAISGFSIEEPVLTRLCSVAMDEFVDWENGTCNFDGEYFKEVLAFAGEYKENSRKGSYSERIQNRDVVLSVGILSSVDAYQIQKELYGGDLAFCGYPVREGTGTVAGFLEDALCINAIKEDQAGAWEFVKFYLLHGYEGQGFPIMRDQFDQAMQHAMEDDFSAGEGGEKERVPKGYYGDGGGNIAVYAASQEEVAAIVQLVESVENLFEHHTVIQNIIEEEAEAFFLGQADLDRAAEKIQNRVALYLQESQ